MEHQVRPLLTEELRHREPRRGSRWLLDEVYVEIGEQKHWRWRAVDEHGVVLDLLLQPHRDTAATRTFFIRRLGAFEVPEVIHTDKRRSSGAAIRARPGRVCGPVQQAGRAIASTHTATGAKPTGVQTTAANARSPGPACPRFEPSPPHPNTRLRRTSTTQADRDTPPLEGSTAAGGLILKPPAARFRPH